MFNMLEKLIDFTKGILLLGDDLHVALDPKIDTSLTRSTLSRPALRRLRSDLHQHALQTHDQGLHILFPSTLFRLTH